MNIDPQGKQNYELTNAVVGTVLELLADRIHVLGAVIDRAEDEDAGVLDDVLAKRAQPEYHALCTAQVALAIQIDTLSQN